MSESELEELYAKALPVRDYLKDDPDFGDYGVFYGNNPEAGRTIAASDGTTLYFETYGNDPSRPWAVSVHTAIYGFPADFTLAIDRLRKTHNVIVPVLRGHGRSALGSSPITTRLLCDDLVEILACVTKGPADFLFSCVGTAIGFALAADHPETVRHLALYAGCALSPYPDFMRVPHATLRRVDPSFFEFFDELMDGDCVESMFDAYGRWIAQDICADRAVFSRIRVPVFLLSPDHDQFFPLPAAIEAYRYIQGARFSVWLGDANCDSETFRMIVRDICRFFTDSL